MTFLERLQALEFGWRDALDILIVAVIVYNLLLLIRGTRAMQMTVGLLAIIAAYFMARTLDLLALEAISRAILFYLPFAIVVLFQHEIRRALTSLGLHPLLPFLATANRETNLVEIVEAAAELSKRKFGALIVLERTQALRMYSETGKAVDSILSADLLVNIFTPNTPLHDGAVVIHENRVVAAGCFLPLSTAAKLPKEYGTRHHAALGVSEETDAIVVVVSEENGSVAMAFQGRLHEHLSPAALMDVLTANIEVNGRRVV